MSNRRFSESQLYAIRNQINVQGLIEESLRIPCRVEKGCFRFLCPLCSGFDTAVNPKTNLARCFQCGKNYNTIDLAMLTRKLSFIESVRFLQTIVPNASRTHVPEGLRVISGSNPGVDDPSLPNVATKTSNHGICHIGKTIDGMLATQHDDIPKQKAGPYEPESAVVQHTVHDRLAELERQLAYLERQLRALTQSINPVLPSK